MNAIMSAEHGLGLFVQCYLLRIHAVSVVNRFADPLTIKGMCNVYQTPRRNAWKTGAPGVVPGVDQLNKKEKPPSNRRELNKKTNQIKSTIKVIVCSFQRRDIPSKGVFQSEPNEHSFQLNLHRYDFANVRFFLLNHRFC